MGEKADFCISNRLVDNLKDTGCRRLTSSLYFMIVLFLLLPSTQVIKSSIFRVTIMAGSVIGVGPILT